MRALLAALAALAGCSNVLGIEDLRGLEAGVPPGDGTVPGTRLTGTLSVSDIQVNGPLSNAALDFTQLPDRIPLGNTTTTDTGSYELRLGAAPGPITGVIHVLGDASGMGLPDSYLYPPPIVGDTTFSMTVLGQDAIQMLGMIANMPPDPLGSFVLVLVTEPDSKRPMPGASVKVADLPVVYATLDGFPDPMLGATSEVGLAYVFNVPPSPQPLPVEVSTNGMADVRLVEIGAPSTAHYLEVVPR